jgi:PAS domain S-box-containing protein
LGKTTLDVGLWTDPQDRAAFVSDLNLEEDVHEKEVKFRIKSGAILTGLLSAKRISAFGEDCILASVSDITEMIKIKERLEEIALHTTP